MKKNILVNTLLVVGVVSGTFLMLESFIECNFITKTPVKFHFALPAGLATLAQSSKADCIPNHYIAIAGDSYAQGKGDWLLEVDPDGNDAFHSAHVLQRLTGRDVISFGKSGASNIKGWVREPIARYRFIREKIDNAVEEPAIVLAYFYSGNDLLENTLEIQESFFPQYGEGALSDNKAWDQYFLASIEKRNVGPYSEFDSNTGWLPKAIYQIVRNELKSKKMSEELGDIEIQQTGIINSVWINGEEINIPDVLQSPGLELSERETEIGFVAVENSLRYLKQYFHRSQVIVVYIPSVIESYAKVSDKVSVSNITATEPEKFAEIHDSSELWQRSNDIADRVKSIAGSLGVPFIDTRPQIRAASEKKMIHGSIDWKHFNREGYEALASSIVSGLIGYGTIPPLPSHEDK